MKKLISLSLVICFIFSLGSVALAAEGFEEIVASDGLSYSVSTYETDTLRISTVTASDGTWAISIYNIAENTLRVITSDSDEILDLNQPAPEPAITPFTVNYVNDIWWGATSTRDDALFNVTDTSMGLKYGYYWELRCPMSSTSSPVKSFFDYGIRRSPAEGFTNQVTSMRSYQITAENAVGTGNAYAIQKEMLLNGATLAKLQSMVTAIGYSASVADYFYGAWQALNSARSFWSSIN